MPLTEQLEKAQGELESLIKNRAALQKSRLDILAIIATQKQVISKFKEKIILKQQMMSLSGQTPIVKKDRIREITESLKQDRNMIKRLLFDLKKSILNSETSTIPTEQCEKIAKLDIEINTKLELLDPWGLGVALANFAKADAKTILKELYPIYCSDGNLPSPAAETEECGQGTPNSSSSATASHSIATQLSLGLNLQRTKKVMDSLQVKRKQEMTLSCSL